MPHLMHASSLMLSLRLSQHGADEDWGRRELFAAAQVGLLLLQRRYGPRCFVPRRFLPAKYDYHRKAPVSPLEAGTAGTDGADGAQVGTAINRRPSCTRCT